MLFGSRQAPVRAVELPITMRVFTYWTYYSMMVVDVSSSR